MQNNFQFKEGLKDTLFNNLIQKIKFINENEMRYLSSIKEHRFFELQMFQEVLHSLLGEYLNTPFRSSHRPSKHVYELNPFLLSKNCIEKQIQIGDLPEIIQKGYIFLNNLLDETEDKEFNLTKIEIGYLDKKKYSAFTRILKLSNYCSGAFDPYVLSMFIHGSCADLKLTDFSDIDTFLIIKSETVYSEEKIIAFKKLWQKSLKFIYHFDSLQHHNHMFATQIDIRLYPYHWLPPQVIKQSKLILGDNRIELNIIKNKYFIFRAFLQLTQRFRENSIKNKVYNEYSFKNDISVMMLLPALYLQSLGYDILKEDSFDHAETLKLDKDNLFEKLTRIRKEWKTSASSRFFLSVKYNYYFRVYYLRYFIKKMKQTDLLENERLKPYFINSLNLLINSMSQKAISWNEYYNREK